MPMNALSIAALRRRYAERRTARANAKSGPTDKPVFSDVVTLGGNCEVAHHVRRVFGMSQAHIFDWWITPFDSVKALIDADFRDLYLARNMDVLARGQAVRCLTYGVIHHHDFERDARTEAVIEDRIDDQLPRLREKYAFLARRFHDTCASRGPVLFVRSWRDVLHVPAHHPKVLPEREPTPDFDGLIGAIEDKYPDLAFEVLFVNFGTHTTDHPKALFSNVEDRGDTTDWTGSTLGWDEMLRPYGLASPAAARA